MILTIQDQRLRDLGRRVLCRSWGGVEEFGELRHGGRKGSGGSGRNLAQANGVREACDWFWVSSMTFGIALGWWKGEW